MRFGQFAFSSRAGHAVLGGLIALAATTASGRSHACGGCFHEPPQPGQETQSTVVVAHRMAFSFSPTQSVLWDQVQYSGAPEAFAWVLPVKPGAYLELSTDAWFETLDAATSTRVTSPQVTCSFGGGGGDFFEGGDYYGSSNGCSRGIGCGASAEAAGFGTGGGAGGGSGGVDPEPPPPVTVVHQETVGPYETVTLHANVPNALPNWLADNGFVIDASVQPIIDAYTSEGFDFIALRLLPGQGVDRMKPVRVVMPGASPTLPLRMVAAGTGPNVGITLYVISEGRYQAQNFPNGRVSQDDVTWDFDNDDSNYATLRTQVMAQAEGRTWNTAYARAKTLLSETFDPNTALQESYVVNGTGYGTIAEAYVRQAIANQEGTTDACVSYLLTAASVSDKVVAACDSHGNPGTGGGGTGGMGTGGMGTGGIGTGGSGGAGAMGGGGSAPVAACKPGEVDGRLLACDTVDDVAVALVGLHPSSVWITRLESNLPRAALGTDLTIGAAGIDEVSSNLLAQSYLGDPCAELGGTPISAKRPPRPQPAGGKAMIANGRTPPLTVAVIVGAVAAALGRRLVRTRKR